MTQVLFTFSKQRNRNGAFFVNGTRLASPMRVTISRPPSSKSQTSSLEPLSSLKLKRRKVELTTVRFMMYHKAMTFKDEETAKDILLTKNPRKCKALGRETKGFRNEIWDEVKLKIVEQGSYLKFTAGEGPTGEKLKQKLLATGDRELVEASRFDRVWGVGFTADNLRKGENGPAPRGLWGENLLGKALMSARRRIREEEAAQNMP